MMNKLIYLLRRVPRSTRRKQSFIIQFDKKKMTETGRSVADECHMMFFLFIVHTWSLIQIKFDRAGQKANEISFL